jgi:CubicO group peptidase (beta-lactamase class C family)
MLAVLAASGHVAWTQSSAPTGQIGTTPKGLDEVVASVMREWKVPGLSVAAIKDGKQVFARGYGYRDVERQLPVTPQTLMAIGSNSKSFTVSLMGMLSDEGRLDWDKPVRAYLPDFELHDDVATRLMTPTDLVDHRSGLPRHDTMWYGRAFTRKDLYQRLRHLEPSATFRQRYQYNNLMFMTAGHLVEQITGQTWDGLVRDRLFKPLAMSRSNTSVRDLPASGDFARPYMQFAGALAAVPFRNLDAVAPAGAINSSAEEMLHYVQMQIDQGVYEGRTILSKRFARRMQSAHSATPVDPDPEVPLYPELSPGGYGLGVAVGSYRGRRLVSHGGGIDGFISSMSWMPDEKLGVIVLSNMSGINPVPTIVMREVYDRLLGLPAVDWIVRAKTDLSRTDAAQKKRDAGRAAERVQGTSPSHPLGDYAGTYEHAGYGAVTVAHEQGRLRLTMDDLSAPLEHFHYDAFRTVGPPASPNHLDAWRVTFTYGPSGKVEAVTVPFEASVSPIVFKRKPAASTTASQTGRE